MAVAVALAVYNLNKPFNPHVEFLYSKRHVFHVVNRTISDVFGNKTFAISIIENHSDEDPSWSLEKAFAENFTIITTFETHEYRFGIAGNLNYTQIQSKDIREAIQAVIGEERRDLPSISYWQGDPFSPSSKGFEKGIIIETTKELTEEQIRRLCETILSYLY